MNTFQARIIDKNQPLKSVSVENLRTLTPSNDSLLQELEIRYGCVFAQWVIDRMP